MLNVYTDASVKSSKAVVTYFIMSEDKYVAYKSNIYNGVSTGLHGELLAIRDGLAVALQHAGESEIITVYSDSNDALSLIKGTSTLKHAKMVLHKLVREIRSGSKDYYTQFLRIKGHQTKHNPNKVVDLTSNTLLRFELQGKLDACVGGDNVCSC